MPYEHPEFIQGLPPRVRNIGRFKIYQTRGDTLADDLEQARRLNLDGVECHPSDLPQVRAYQFRALIVRGSPSASDSLDGFDQLEAFGGAGFDLEPLHQLEVCYTGQRARLPKPAPNLKWLSLASIEWEDLHGLDAPQLEFLRVDQGKLTTLAGIERCRALRRLDVYGARRLQDISALADLPELRVLDFESCGKLDPTGLSGNQHLEELALVSCGKLASLSFLRSLPNLRSFGFAKTTIRDGDLRPLLGGRITQVHFTGNRDYTHTLKEVQAQLAARHPRTVSAEEGQPSVFGHPGRIDGPPVEIDIETDDADAIEAWRTRLPDLIVAARQCLADDPGESGLLYAEHHIAEIEPKAWESVHGLDHTPTVAELLALLQPVALWGDPTECLHLDFSIGEDLTQYVLSFEVRPDGTLGDIDMES